MKECTKCKQVKTDADFYKASSSKDGLQSACKECANVGTKLSRNKCGDKHKQYVNQTRINYRDRLYTWKGKIGCCVCNEQDPVCLDLHHKNPTEKEFTVGARNCCWDKLTEEIIKCVLVCSNCHRKIHAGHLNDVDLPLVTKEQCLL